jgi:hypothetical protein
MTELGDYISPGKIEDDEELREQDELLEEEDLKALRGRNSFVDDVLEKHQRGRILTDNQIDGLRSVKEQTIEQMGSLEEYVEVRNKERALSGVINQLHWNDVTDKFWSGSKDHDGHKNIISDFRSELGKSETPALTEKQREYAMNILEQYSDKIRRYFAKEDQKTPDHEELQEICEWQGGWVAVNRIKTTTGLSSKRDTWEEWRFWQHFEEKDEAFNRVKEQCDGRIIDEKQWLVLPVGRFYSGEPSQEVNKLLERMEERVKDKEEVYGFLNLILDQEELLEAAVDIRPGDD